MNPIAWRNEKRKLADLIPFEGNPRFATEKDVADLTNSLDQFGLADPIIINVDNRIIGGHFRARIEKSRGTEEVDVRVPDRQLTEAEHRELLLRLNKNTGRWDPDLLAHLEIAELEKVGFTLDELTGFGITPPDAPTAATTLKKPKVTITFTSLEDLASARDALKAIADEHEATFAVSGGEV